MRQVVQDCQSALDWTATAVKDKFYPGSTWNPYFPLQGDQAKFREALDKQIKGLEADRLHIAAAFERHQPYQSGKEALGHLHALRKVNTHRDFTAQTRKERRAVRVQTGGGYVEYGQGVRFNPGGGITIGPGGGMTISGAGVQIGPHGTSIGGVPVDPRTQRPIPHPSQSVMQTVYVDWRFNDPNVSVLPALTDLTALTRSAVEDVRREAQL